MQEKKEWEAPKLVEMDTANTLNGHLGPGNDGGYGNPGFSAS